MGNMSKSEYEETIILKWGEQVTIWPSVDRASGESRDTEPGAQPWTAEYRGLSPDGSRVYVMTEHGLRNVKPEHLRP